MIVFIYAHMISYDIIYAVSYDPQTFIMTLLHGNVVMFISAFFSTKKAITILFGAPAFDILPS